MLLSAMSMMDMMKDMDMPDFSGADMGDLFRRHADDECIPEYIGK